MSFWYTDCESMFEGNCLLTQESLHSCLSTPMLWLNGGEVWPAASHGPGTGPPDIQRGQPLMKSAQILARNLSCVKCLGDVGAGRPHMITSWHQRMKLGWIGCKVAALLNFLFWLASCNVLVFMLWIILHCVTRVTMGDHGGWIRAVSSVSRKYLLTSGWCWSQSWL